MHPYRKLQVLCFSQSTACAEGEGSPADTVSKFRHAMQFWQKLKAAAWGPEETRGVRSTGWARQEGPGSRNEGPSSSRATRDNWKRQEALDNWARATTRPEYNDLIW